MLTIRSGPSLSGLLLLAAALVTATPLGAQEPPFTIVRLDLNTRITRGTLPFKEPFYLVGVAPPGARTVEVRYRERTRDDNDGVDCRAAGGWSETSSWLRAETADTFFAHVPELNANRLYNICVISTVRPVGDALTVFRRQAARLLDQRLRELENAGPMPNPFPGEEMRRIKASFVKALGEQTGRTVLPGEPGTVFDTMSKSLPPEHSNVLQAILRQQDQRRDRIQALGSTADQVEQHAGAAGDPVRAVVGDARLASFAHAAVPGVRPPGIAPETYGLAISTALYLTAATPPRLRELSLGETRADPLAPTSGPLPPPALASVWSPAELEERAANLDYTVQAVRALGATVAAGGGRSGLLAAAGWKPRDAAEVSRGLSGLLFLLETQQGALATLRMAVRERARLVESAAEAASAEASRGVSLEGSSVIEYQARAKSMISADAGLAAVYGVGAVPYFGANFYFEPVNKAVPLRFRGRTGDRLSLTIGVTAQSVEDAGERDDLFGSFGLLLGGGVRFADPLRLSGGVVLLREEVGDPINPDKPIRLAPFISLSLDWDVRSTLGRLTDKLF